MGKRKIENHCLIIKVFCSWREECKPWATKKLRFIWYTWPIFRLLATVPYNCFWLTSHQDSTHASHGHLLHSVVKFYRNTAILNIKQNIYEFCLILKILYSFLSKGSLNIPEYRCLLIGRVQYLYTIKHAVENIAYRFQSISVTLLSLIRTITTSKYLVFQFLIFVGPNVYKNENIIRKQCLHTSQKLRSTLFM